jgi:hypothetical protein
MAHRSNIEDSIWDIRQVILKLKQENLLKKINGRNKEVERKIDNIRAEIVNVRQGVIVDSLLKKHIRGADEFLAERENKNPAGLSERGNTELSKAGVLRYLL